MEHLGALPSIEEDGSPMQGAAPRELAEGVIQEKARADQQGTEAANEKKKKRGRRTAKHKGEEELREVWLHNSSGKPQLMAAIGHATKHGKGRVIAIVNQEHHCDQRT